MDAKVLNNQGITYAKKGEYDLAISIMKNIKN